MQIFVKTHTAGKTYCIDIEKTDTVKTLKEKIHEKSRIQTEAQFLIFAGKPLQDEHTLADYNIQKDNAVHLGLRLLGGHIGDDDDDDVEC